MGDPRFEDYGATCHDAAQRFGVAPDIHPDDQLFRFLLNNPVFESPHQAIAHYFDDGADSADKLRRVLGEICELTDPTLELLEFAAGFGRVTRHLPAALPRCRITACDIHPSAIPFLRDRLHTPAILSANIPERFTPSQRFDVVFALSFFSHIPKETFRRWIDTLAAVLRPSGFLIFTTHGVKSQQHIPQSVFDADGVFFSADSDQQDLDPAEYGTAIVRPQYVLAGVSPQLRLRYFHEAFWWTHQDVYVFQQCAT